MKTNGSSRNIDPRSAGFAAIFHAMAREEPGATVEEMCGKLSVVLGIDGVKEWLAQTGLHRVAGGWYSEPFDQWIASFVLRHEARMDGETRRVVLDFTGAYECSKIVRSFMSNEDSRDLMQPVLDYLGDAIGIAPSRIMKRQDIYSGLSTGKIFVFIEYGDPESIRQGERIYFDLDLDRCANIDFQKESAATMLPLSEFVAVEFASEGEALECTNAFSSEDFKSKYRAVVYVDGEPVHESA